VDLRHSFSWGTLLAVAAAGYGAVAALVFRLGLRRYQSGSRFA
jgi:hypothetical protein